MVEHSAAPIAAPVSATVTIEYADGTTDVYDIPKIVGVVREHRNDSTWEFLLTLGLRFTLAEFGPVWTLTRYGPGAERPRRRRPLRGRR